MARFTEELGNRLHDLSGITVRVDLTETGFTDFVTLGHLLVFIDKIVNAGATVVLLRPTEGHPDSVDAESARRQRQRQHCRLFLKQSGFTAALRTAGWPEQNIDLTQQAPPHSGSAAAGDEQIEEPRPPRKLRRMVPYRWLAAPGGSPSDVAVLETALLDMGLAPETAAAVAEGLFAELIDTPVAAENSVPHGKLLVGVCVVAPGSYEPQHEDFDAGLRPFVEWASSRESPLVRIFVGGTDRPEAFDRVVHHGSSRWSGDRAQRVRSKVSQIVRSYQGAFLVSSDGFASGMTFGGVAGELLPGRAVPGPPTAVFECDLLVSPGPDAILSDHEVEAKEEVAGRDRTSLGCVTVAMRAAGGLDDDVLATVRDHLDRLTITSSLGLVLAINADFGGVGPGHREILATLRQVLDIARQTTSAAVLVAALPAVNRRLLALAVDDLLAEDATSADAPLRPVLLIAPENRHYWIGADDAAREVLNHLSHAGQGCVLGALVESGSLASKLDGVRRIHEQTVLLLVHEDYVRLQVTPEDAINALTSHLTRQIEKAIESGDHAGVERGLFLTPGLRFTTRWCDIHTLLEHTETEQLAGFALGCKVKMMIKGVDRPLPPSVLRLGTVSREFASAFARSLTGSERYFNSAASLRLDRASGTLPLSAQVLILTGLVATEDDIAIVLDELAALGMTTVAIAAVVDARSNQASGTGTREMTFHTSRPRLVSLASVDIEPRDEVGDSRYVVVDPLLDRPDGTVKPELQALMGQEYYVETLKRTRAARLAHIARPAGRHYTAYVDPTLLFRDEKWAQRFRASAVRTIFEAQATLDDGRGPVETVCIAYPAETTDNIAEVARDLADAVATQSRLRPPEVVPIPRAVLGTHWLLPASVTFSAAQHVVMLDSATGSGRTIQQMLRVAAAPDVRLITCIILLNGLDDLDALAFQQITAMSAPRLSETSRHTEVKSIPVRVHFVARSAVSSLDARDCDVCELRSAYETMPLLASLPVKLEKQRTWMLRNLTPRSKRRAFEEEASDLAGMHIGQDDCVAYLDWKFDLREAATSTRHRQYVVEKLARARTDPQVGDALVRLLAAETSWLRSAPLSFVSVRRQVGELAKNLVLGDDALPVDPSLQTQALILLAAVQPLEFIRHFAELISSTEHRVVSGQILLEALRIIVGPAAPWRTSREELVQLFLHELNMIEADLRGRTGGQAVTYGRATLSDIRYLISHARRRLLPVPIDKQSAWAGLRNYRRSVDEHTYENIMFLVIGTIDYLAKGVPADRRAISDDWRRCANFLTLDVLPNLVPLREYLLSRQVLSGLTGADVSRWEDVVKGGGAQRVDSITNNIESILDSADGSEVSVGTLLADLRWWDRHFLTAIVEPGVSDKGAFLTEIVQKCPADPVAALKHVFADTKVVVDRGREQVPASSLLAFCTDDLLREAFGHVRVNAEKYHRTDGADELEFEIVVRVPEDRPGQIAVSIRNTNSVPGTQGRGRGLRTLRDRLKAFDARLETIDDVAPPWSFGVLITLERWRMH